MMESRQEGVDVLKKAYVDGGLTPDMPAIEQAVDEFAGSPVVALLSDLVNDLANGSLTKTVHLALILAYRHPEYGRLAYGLLDRHQVRPSADDLHQAVDRLVEEYPVGFEQGQA